MILHFFVYIFSLFLINASSESRSIYEFDSYQDQYWSYFINETQPQNFEFIFPFFDESSVKFYIYDRKFQEVRQELKINDTNLLKEGNFWKPNRPTKIIVHGFTGSSMDPTMVKFKNKLIERDDDLNVIALDYGPIASMYYPWASHYSEKVGKVGSKLIDYLVENGAKLSDFHVIGLSLGAHVAGFVGKHTKHGKIARVTGLDPALPGFMTENEQGRLDKIDAEFVDCVHTCGGKVGFMTPICHADYYVNGGKLQPGCGDSFIIKYGCSHVRAQDLFTESSEKGHNFPALKCKTLTDTGPVNCDDEGDLMGYSADTSEGLFSVQTGPEYPFCHYN